MCIVILANMVDIFNEIIITLIKLKAKHNRIRMVKLKKTSITTASKKTLSLLIKFYNDVG